MRLAALSALLGVAAVLEFTLLRRIVFHQAGGWGDPDGMFPYVIAWASIPFIWSALLVVAAVVRRIAATRVTTPFIVVAVAGAVLAFIALRQYGHTTPLLMMVGLGIQSIALLVATVRTFMPPNAPVNPDARDVPPPTTAVGARAGHRER